MIPGPQSNSSWPTYLVLYNRFLLLSNHQIWPPQRLLKSPSTVKFLWPDRPASSPGAAELRRPSVPLHALASVKPRARPVGSIRPWTSDSDPSVPDSSFAARGKTEPAGRTANCFILYLSLQPPSSEPGGEIRFLRRRSIVNLPPVQTETAVRLTAIYCRSRFFTAVFYGCFLPLSSIDHTSHSHRSFAKPSTTLSS